MASAESSFRPRVIEENYSSDGAGQYDFGNQTHEFGGPPTGKSQDANALDRALSLSSGSEDAPSDTAYLPEAAGSDQPKSDEESFDESRSPRKRRAQSSLHADEEGRPVKRTKGTYNRAYLDLLNLDILDAAAQHVPDDNRVALPESQIGLTLWTPTEKELFFEALGRLGRDDVPGIASRIRTKEEIEIRQYMKLLDDAFRQRKRHGELSSLELADFPAAVEISRECCETLDDAAESLARRQENHEEAFEKTKWGDEFLVRAENCEEIENLYAPEHELGPTTLFNTSVWLKMSETLFMNSAQEKDNWRSISDERPSIRLTALEDFYSLTFCITQRLVTSAIYIAESRIRCKRAPHPTKTRELVKRKDMEAAIASLNLTPDRTNFWGKCPRRLGLHAHEDRPHFNEPQTDPIPYDEVEHALGVKNDRFNTLRSWDSSSISSDSSVSGSSKEEDENVVEETSTAWDSDDDDEIKEEAKEVLLHAAVDRPQTTRERQALILRIKAEREQEEHAEALDARATYKKEKGLWRLLGRHPSQPLQKPTAPERNQKAKLSVNDVYSAGLDWRRQTQYVSEWEVAPSLHK